MNGKDKLFQFFHNKFPFNKEGLDEFVTAFKIKKCKKGELILSSGEVENELRFLDKGIVREFYSSALKEKNIHFYIESEFVTDFFSFNNTLQTKKYQECLTDIQLRTISKDKLISFTNKYPCGLVFFESIFQRIIAKKQTDEYNHCTKSVDELYLEIMKNNPEWLQQVPQYHIASYLGITPETLSRIRKRI